MTEYQFKKREAEFEKEHEAYFKEISDADYLHEKLNSIIKFVKNCSKKINN